MSTLLPRVPLENHFFLLHVSPYYTGALGKIYENPWENLGDIMVNGANSPLSLLRLLTRISVYAKTAAHQQSNGRMTQKCGEWRD